MSGFIIGLAVGIGLAEVACQFLANFSIVGAIWKSLRGQGKQ